MGRPKKDPEKVRSKTIKIRLTKEELDRLDSITKWAKMDRSETIRTLIFEAKNIYNPEE